jgi:hypothetical protein
MFSESVGLTVLSLKIKLSLLRDETECSVIIAKHKN